VCTKLRPRGPRKCNIQSPSASRSWLEQRRRRSRSQHLSSKDRRPDTDRTLRSQQERSAPGGSSAGSFRPVVRSIRLEPRRPRHSTKLRIRRAADLLNGQKLTRLLLAPQTVRYVLKFDLGATLRTTPYDQESEQWSLGNHSVLCLPGDRRFNW
jgi:hypothetical protein